MPKKGEVQIVYKKLGRQKADGIAWTLDNTIELDPRLKGKEHLEILIHEMLHILNPKWAEIKVMGHAKRLADILWNEKYRRIDQ